MRLFLPACVTLLALTGFCPVQAPGSMAMGASAAASPAPPAEIPVSVAPPPSVVDEPGSPAMEAALWLPDPVLARPLAARAADARKNPDEPAGLPLNSRFTLTGEVRGLMKLFEDSQDQTANRQPLHVGVGLRYTF